MRPALLVSALLVGCTTPGGVPADEKVEVGIGFRYYWEIGRAQVELQYKRKPVFLWAGDGVEVKIGSQDPLKVSDVIDTIQTLGLIDGIKAVRKGELVKDTWIAPETWVRLAPVANPQGADATFTEEPTDEVAPAGATVWDRTPWLRGPNRLDMLWGVPLQLRVLRSDGDWCDADGSVTFEALNVYGVTGYGRVGCTMASGDSVDWSVQIEAVDGVMTATVFDESMGATPTPATVDDQGDVHFAATCGDGCTLNQTLDLAW